MTVSFLHLNTFARDELRKQRRANLFDFVWGMFPVLHPGGDEFVAAWHVRAMCFELQRAALLQTRRLLITVPPRHLKTICASVATTAFILGRDPSAKVIIATYGNELSSNILRDLRTVMSSSYYRDLFPQTRAYARGPVIFTPEGGFVRVTSVGGSITGMGADYIIVDDLMKANDQKSELERTNTKEFLSGTLMTRFNNKSKGCLIAIQQRLHEDDVAAFLIGVGTFTHLNLPAFAVEDQTIQLSDNQFHKRRRGDVLFPEREPASVLNEFRGLMTPQAFEAQFQQNPTPEGGGLIDWTWWGTYEEAPSRDECTHVAQSWDTANKDKESSDWSVGTTYGKHDGAWHVLDLVRAKLDSFELKERILQQMTKWRPDHILIEDHGSGTFVLNQLRRQHKIARSKLIAITPTIGKQQRFINAVSMLKSERFLLPSSAPWLHEFHRELTSFPNGRYDDQVDSFSQFACYLISRRAQTFESKGIRPLGQAYNRSR